MNARHSSLIRSLSAPLEPVPTGQKALLPALSGVRAVVFDIYGTLIISGVGDISLAGSTDRGDALQACLKHFGIVPAEKAVVLSERFQDCILKAQDHQRARGVEFPEVEIREVWRNFLNSLNSPAGLSENHLEEGKIEDLAIRFECRVNPVWPMPGMEGVIAQLQKAGKTLGIVSNAQFFTPLLFPAFTGKTLNELGFREESCLYSFALREGKPSTRLYEKLINSFEPLRIEPAEMLFIGNDLRNDIAPAQRCGLRTALFAGDRRSLRWRPDDPFCQGVQPDAILNDLRQLPEVLRIG
jgi:putative hydrolase of the HAD superfamily